MRPIRVSRKQWAQRLARRPSTYADEIRPALVEDVPCPVHGAEGGYLVFDTDHPAWIAAMVKYRPRDVLRGQRTGCSGCGGDKAALAAMRGDPEAAEQVLREGL